MVFYLKYRPQRISDLDSEKVKNTLTARLSKAGSVPHAFLLTGPKGLGKTSTARIIAKTINCERKKDIEPCNKCEQCLSIINGTNLDVLEIDAASNRGIDEIRDLRDKIKLAPASSKKKIYIIDEVHMLTAEAFNALLKTLEEPPNHAMFLLCTTDLHKVPQTIVSRCFPIVFTRATVDEIIHSLKRIITSERIAIDKEALIEIAKASDGSFRDASKLLEQAAAVVGRKKIRQEAITDLLGIAINTDTLLLLLKEKNTKEALVWLAKSVDGGLNLKAWLEDCLSLLHSMLLAKYHVTNGPLASTVARFDVDELRRLLILFTRAHQELRSAVIPQLPVELAIIEYCMDREKER